MICSFITICSPPYREGLGEGLLPFVGLGGRILFFFF